MAKFKKGAEVEWKWGPSFATGKVEEIHTETIERTIKGKKIVRHGTRENPAYVLKQKKGNLVLKLESELYSAERKHGWA